MSHFYGDLQGCRGRATRCGSKQSGANSHVRGWNIGAQVFVYVDDDGNDVVSVSLTGGSNGPHFLKDLGAYYFNKKKQLRRKK